MSARRRRGIEYKTPDELVLMRKAGRVTQEILDAVGREVRAGVSTLELDAIARELIAAHGAASNFLNYGAEWGIPAYPAVACISVNDVIVHGIPSEQVLTEGDIVSIDFGVVIDGWHGDAARTFQVGEVSPEAAGLVEATRQAMWAGIAAARLGGRIGDISHAVASAAESLGDYGIVEDYVGHGIGTAMHQDPDVPNFGRAHRGPRIELGMALAIEPMLTLGNQANHTLDDEWTIVTDDHSFAAHWENTMTVTERGVWVLTEADGGEAELAKRGVPFGPLAD